MPLSEHEQRILAEIERRLKLAAVGFVVGLIVLVAGFAQNVALGVAGFVIMLVAIFEFVRTLRRRATVEQRPQAPGKATEAPPARPSSPSKGIESWWGKMTERWRQRWEERGGPPPPS